MQKFHFPHFSSNFHRSFLFFLEHSSMLSSIWPFGWASRPPEKALATPRMGKSPTQEGPGYATDGQVAPREGPGYATDGQVAHPRRPWLRHRWASRPPEKALATPLQSIFFSTFAEWYQLDHPYVMPPHPTTQHACFYQNYLSYQRS